MAQNRLDGLSKCCRVLCVNEHIESLCTLSVLYNTATTNVYANIYTLCRGSRNMSGF